MLCSKSNNLLNLECHPSSLVFVSSEGRVSAKRKDGLKRDNFVLVLSSSKLWDQFKSDHKIQSLLPADIDKTPPNAEQTFDALIWAKFNDVKDLRLSEWRPMVEFFQDPANPPISPVLLKLISTESQCSVPNSGKFNLREADKSAEGFIKDNSAKSTLSANTTAERLFTSFLREYFQNPNLNIEDVDQKDLPDLVAKFFMSLQKENGDQYNAGTVQTYFHALQRVFLEKLKVDLKNDTKYALVPKILAKKQKVCVESGETPGKHRSFAIPQEALAKGWSQGAFGNSNPSALLAACILHIQAKFGTRSAGELYNITVGDIALGPIRDDGIPSHLSLNFRLRKTQRGLKGQGAREVVPKIYPSDSDPARCGIRLFLLLQSKKSPDCQKDDSRLFLNVKNVSKQDWSNVPVWYTSSPVGINSISKIVPKQLESVGVDTKSLRITGTSIRKTAMDGSMGSGMDGSVASMIHGHSTLAAKTSYMSMDDPTMKAANKVLQNVITGERSVGENFDTYFGEERKKEAAAVEIFKEGEVVSKEAKKRKTSKQHRTTSSSDSSDSEEPLSRKELSRQNRKLLRTISELKESLQPRATNVHPTFLPYAAHNFQPNFNSGRLN